MATCFQDSDGYFLEDNDKMIMFARGRTVPDSGGTGWAVGGLFFHQDGSTTEALYVNCGTTASCNFTGLISTAVSKEIDFTGMGSTIATMRFYNDTNTIAVDRLVANPTCSDNTDNAGSDGAIAIDIAGSIKYIPWYHEWRRGKVVDEWVDYD